MQDRTPFGDEAARSRALRSIMILIACVALSPCCRERSVELDEVQRMAYAVKPAVVRVNAYATAMVTIDPARGSSSATIAPGGVSVRTGTGGSGSGFVVHPDGWIVTSAHVIEPTIDEEAIRSQLLRNGAIAILQNALEDDILRALVRSGEIEQAIDRIIERATLSEVEVVNRVDLSNGESHPFETRQLSRSISHGGVDVALLHIPARQLPTLLLARSESRLQERIWIAGYPSVASSRDSELGGWLSSETDLEPTITSGSITAVRKSVDSLPLYQTDAPIYPGHSGGPAVDRHGNVIGIPSWGHAEADQIRFLIQSTTIRSFIEGAGVPLDVQGPFNTVYRDALESAARGNWGSAAARLREADSIFPGSPDVRRFLNEAEQAGSSSRFAWTEGAAIVSFLAAILIVVTAGLRLRWVFRPRLEFPPIREEIVVSPLRGDRNGEKALSFNEKEPDSLGTFTVLNGREAGRRMDLGGSGIRIGRESRYCEIVLSDPKISRLHAEVVSFRGRTMLIDRNSSNGTFVNDERIERRFLSDGDIIYFGGRHAVAVAFTV